MRPVVLALALAPLTGCIIIDADDFDVEPDLDMEGFEDGDGPRGRDGRVRGDLGPVRDFDGRGGDIDATAQQGWSSITVTTYDDGGRMGMLILDIEADIRAVPSGTYRFSDDGSTDGALSGVYVTGCSSSFLADYDAPAREGVVIIDNDGDECVVDVEAELPDDDGVMATASGSFTLES